MSGLGSVVARIGAIERTVSGVQVPMGAGGAAGAVGAASFADALNQAALMDAAASSGTMAATAPTAATMAAPAPAAAAAPTAAAVAPVTEATVRRPGTASVSASDNRTKGSGSASYRPAHVTETDEKVWNDCTWAAATMWIDKLTGGASKVDREALRAASGDKTGGSSLGDVVRGARKLLDLDLRAAHDEKLTVGGLLERLAAGGGAIVQGSYASLPENLTRHDPGFAAKGVAGSGHAVYVGPLDRTTGKVWWDDPLAPAGGRGEWISTKDLKAFLWTDSHGRVSAMATPAASGLASAPSRDTAAQPGAATASVSAAARSSGVDPLLLTAYLDVTHTPSDTGAIAHGAQELAAAVSRYGRADLALESIGAAQAGSTRLAEGAVFAGEVLVAWADRLDRGSGG